VPARHPILVEADLVVPATFDPILEDAGFTLARHRQEMPDSGAWLYQRAWERPAGGRRPQYVDLQISVNPRDVPWVARIVLGEGRNRFPEQEWNGIALWRMVLAAEPGNVGPARNGYGIDQPADVERVLHVAASDLQRSAAAFLDGDLKPFLELRRLEEGGRPRLRVAVARETLKAYVRVADWGLRIGAAVARRGWRRRPRK
jgi:hypothetical protein